MKLPIYIDHHATTPLDPKVLEAMMPYLTDIFGNASSNHIFGWQAEAAVKKARGQVAKVLGADPREIIFTSGATESNNIMIRGVAQRHADRGKHLITLGVEHKSVLDPMRYLERHGYQVTYLSVDKYGQMDLDELKKAITDSTILISIMAANNEVGTLYPLEEIGKIASRHGIFFHSDVSQGIGKIPFNVDQTGVSFASLSAHKVYGPKGVGALYIRGLHLRSPIDPLVYGGGQEQGLRSGTLNVAGIVGLGEALEVASESMEEESQRLKTLRDRLYASILSGSEGVFLNGHPKHRLPGNLNLSFEGIRADVLMVELRDVALSSGSACNTDSAKPSYVLEAMGLRKELLISSIRYGLGRFNTEEEIAFVAEKTISAVKRIRNYFV